MMTVSYLLTDLCEHTSTLWISRDYTLFAHKKKFITYGYEQLRL